MLVASSNGGCYLVTFQARLVDCVKILLVVGRGFFYLGWARGFPRKNRVFFISADIYFLFCQEHPVRTGISTICENLATFGRTQFTPLLCLVLVNSTIISDISISFGDSYMKMFQSIRFKF